MSQLPGKFKTSMVYGGLLINLFINSDVILIVMHRGLSKVKKNYLQAAIVGGIHHAEKILR